MHRERLGAGGWSLNPGGALDTPGAPPPDGESPPAAAGLPNCGSRACRSTARRPCQLGALRGLVHRRERRLRVGLDRGRRGALHSRRQHLDLPEPAGRRRHLPLQRLPVPAILLFEPGPEQPPTANTCPNNVAGHGITSLIGIFYVPAASATIVGGSSYLATIAGGLIAWSATIKGNGGVSIMADPTLRAWPSAVRLTQ